jgi:hypothetical protein
MAALILALQQFPFSFHAVTRHSLGGFSDDYCSSR